MRVLVTGANGYVGSAVVAALLQAGHSPVALVRGDRSRVPVGVEVRSGDLLDPASLMAAMVDMEAVCHLAGLTRARESWDRPLDYFRVNVGGTLALLGAMVAAGVKRVVFASTGSIYGSPEQQPMTEDFRDAAPHPYAASKQAAECAVEWQARAGGMSAVVLRLFNVAGGDDPDQTRIVPRVLAVASGQSPNLEVNGDGSAIRDLLNVSDAAEAFVASLAHGPDAVRRYNVGSGVGASVMEIVKAAERVTGQPVPVVHRPPADEPARLLSDASRALAELGWKPRHSIVDEILRDAWSATYARARD